MNNPVWNHVVEDMLQRNEEGAKKYNRYLMPNCPDNMLQHLYEELLDAAVYTKTLLLQQQHAKEVDRQLPLDLGDFK